MKLNFETNTMRVVYKLVVLSRVRPGFNEYPVTN